MNVNERIEALMNKAGNTIADLPRPSYYDVNRMTDAIQAAYESYNSDRSFDDADNTIAVCANYICHLSDIIDRMEWALNNALVTEDEDEDEEGEEINE